MDLVDLLDTTPRLIKIGGKLKHVWADGRVTPVIRGGDGPDDGGAGAGQGDGGQGGSGDGGQGGSFKPITSQEEFDRMVQSRIDRAIRSARQGLPSDDELAEIRRKAEAHDAAEAANLSELERERNRAEAAEAAAQAASERAERLARRSAIIAEASKANAVDPDVVAELLAGTDAVTIDDAGQVTGADTAVKTLLEDKPFLVAANGTSGRVDLGQGRSRGDGEGRSSGLAAGRERWEQRNAGTKK